MLPDIYPLLPAPAEALEVEERWPVVQVEFERLYRQVRSLADRPLRRIVLRYRGLSDDEKDVLVRFHAAMRGRAGRFSYVSHNNLVRDGGFETGPVTLYQAGANLLTNPGFEAGDQDWASDSGTIAVTNDAASARTGSWAARRIAYSAASDAIRVLDKFPVRPGESFYAEGWVRCYDTPVAQGWQSDETPGPGFVDLTAALNSPAPDACSPFPAAEAVGDAFYIGHTNTFTSLIINVGTAGSGSPAVVWEYWDGAAWVALPSVIDGTKAFTVGGTSFVSWTLPTGWAARTINGSASLYYVRARLTAVYGATDPNITQAWIGANGSAVFRVSFYDARNVEIASVSGPALDPAPAWTKSSAVGRAPLTAAYAQPNFVFQSSTAGEWWFDDAYCRRYAEPWNIAPTDGYPVDDANLQSGSKRSGAFALRVDPVVGSTTGPLSTPCVGLGVVGNFTTPVGTCTLTGDFTVELWVKRTGGDTGYAQLLSKDSDAGPIAYGIHEVLGTFRPYAIARIGGVEYAVQSPNALPLGTWRHLAEVRQGASLRLYEDGALVAESTVPSGSVDPNSAGKIAVNILGGALACDIDELRVWNIARSQADIVNDMFRTLLGTEAGLLGYWKLNEGTGTTAYDSSPYANHGTITGGVWKARAYADGTAVVASTSQFSVVPGEELWCGWYVKADAIGAAAYAAVRCYDASGAFVGNAVVAGFGNTTNVKGWTFLSAYGTVPSGAAYAELALVNTGNDNRGAINWYADDVVVRRVIPCRFARDELQWELRAGSNRWDGTVELEEAP